MSVRSYSRRRNQADVMLRGIYQEICMKHRTNTMGVATLMIWGAESCKQTCIALCTLAVHWNFVLLIHSWTLGRICFKLNSACFNNDSRMGLSTMTFPIMFYSFDAAPGPVQVNHSYPTCNAGCLRPYLASHLSLVGQKVTVWLALFFLHTQSLKVYLFLELVYASSSLFLWSQVVMVRVR